MTKRMLIDATHAEETRVVVLDGNRLEDFDVETSTKRQLKGNIYLAKVVRVEPSLQAAFVEYGGNRHGFLAFGEIHPDYYQIPIADRERLIAAQEAELRAEEEEEDRAAAAAEAGTEQPRIANAETTVEAARLPSEESAFEAVWTETEASGPAEPANDEAAAPPAEAAAQPVDAPSAEIAAPEPPAPSAADEAQVAAAPLAIQAMTIVGDVPPHENEEPAPVLHDERPDVTDGGHLAPADQAANAEFSPTTEPRIGAVAPDSADEAAGNDADDDGEPPQPAPETVGGSDGGSDVSDRRIPPRFLRNYKIQEVIKRRQILLVQVVKEERGTKGAALTTYISLAGRFSVLMPNSPSGGGISRKITSAADRRRLKEITAELDLPRGMGLIIRTAGAQRPKPEILRDCEYLMRLWDDIREQTMRSIAPALIYEEASLIKRAIRDVYSRDIEEIQVDGEDGWRAARDFMRMLMPAHAKKVQLWNDPSQKLFARYGVDAQLDAMLQPTVQLKSGGYLVINQTEALVAIDVNSGRATRERNVEETALRTNLEAADETARQLRLRDLAGLIVIDFIDMDERRNNVAVEKRLKEALKNDRARIQVGTISHFGLMEMSRQRLRPSLAETSSIPCPHCGGTGHIRSTESAAISVLRAIEEEGGKRRAAEIVVHVATSVALYLLNHKRDRLAEIERRYAMAVTFAGDDTLLPPDVRIERVRAQVPGAPVAITVDSPPAPRAATVRDDADMVEEDADDIDLGDEADEAEEAGQAASAPNGASGSDEDGERRRRRRRRRRGGARRDELTPGLPEGAAEPPSDVAAEAPMVADADADGAAHVEGVPESALPDVAETRGAEADGGDDGRARRRGRRGGRRRRRDEGGAGAAADAPDFTEQPDLPPLPAAGYAGPTPADPFGGVGFDIFDVMDQVERAAERPDARPADQAAPVLATPEPGPLERAPSIEPPSAEPPTAEPPAAAIAPPVPAPETPASEPEPGPAPLAATPPAPAPEAAHTAPEPEPEPEPAPEPEPLIKPIIVGVDTLAKPVERRRGWWRR